MASQSENTCVHCGRNEQSVPLTTWRYRGRNLVICSDCLPNLIHRRETVLNNLDTAGTAPDSRLADDPADH